MPNNASPYCQTARFPNKAAAGEIYTSLQTLVFEEQNNCDLSVYRLKITEGWHMVVLGETPDDKLHQRIEALLSKGTIVNLQHERPDVIDYLQSRRVQAIQIAPWVEGHYHTTEE